jgi:hypothetical protein
MDSLGFSGSTPCFLGGLLMSEADEFFRRRLDQMIDLRHRLAVLASRMPWQELGGNIAAQLARRIRTGKKFEGADLFGPVSRAVAPGATGAGRPRLPLRLMISLRYLKHAFSESDESGRTPCMSTGAIGVLRIKTQASKSTIMAKSSIG